MPERYIPLSEANTERIRTTLTLPYHMEEEVGLNVKSTELLCQLGGIESVSIKNNNDRPNPVIVGMTQQGTALAGFTATESLAKYQNTNKSKGIPSSASWSSLEVSINSDDVRLQLDTQRKDIKDPNNWARIVDRSLKDSIASASFQNLVKSRAKQMGFVLLVNMLPTTFFIQNYLSKNTLGMAFSFVNWQTITKFFDITNYGIEKPGKGKRWSLSIYEFPELDRMFIQGTIMPFVKLASKLEK